MSDDEVEFWGKDWGPQNEILSSDGKTKTRTWMDSTKTEQLKSKLNDEQYKVVVERGTEKAFTGKYDKHFKDGKYYCVVCGAELFASEEKFDSACGWPAFAKGNKSNIAEKEDKSYGVDRTEVICDSCGAHLGHVFPDGPPKMGGMRYCINSASLDFKPKSKENSNESKS